MFAKAGIVRNAASLEEAIVSLDKDIAGANYSVNAAETANIALMSKLITQSALRRQESRGAHYRSDYPHIDDKFAVRQIVYNQAPIEGHRWIETKDLCPSSN